jgi:cobalt/nickel transport system permease protein
MHIPDGLLSPINPTTHTLNPADTAVLLATWAITIPFLIYSWKKTRATYSAGFASSLAIISALVFVVQMLTFPVAGGTSVHILGGTLVAIILGPFAGMLSMTMVLGMQAIFFADGGLLAFGANTLNMAVIGSLSFFLVKLLAGNARSGKRFFGSVFIATFASATLTAVLTGVEIGVSQAFAVSGGLALTVPAMLGVYLVEGLVEATLTSYVAAGLIVALPRLSHFSLAGIGMLRGTPTLNSAKPRLGSRPRFPMKKLSMTVVALMVCFALLLPFTSKTPDGLQTLTQNSASTQQPAWNGFMGGYSVAVGDPYVSALIAGLVGTVVVLVSGFALGSTVNKKKAASMAHP